MRGRLVPSFAPALFSIALLSASALAAQTPLDQAIAAKFPETIATADRSDIVTAGSVMTLKKPGLVLFATTASSKATTQYKDGKLSQTAGTRMASTSLFGHTATNIVQRTYVQNEKLWLIDIKDVSDGVLLQMLSDQVGDNRFTGFLKIPFPKGGTPDSAEIIKQISEVMTPDSGGEAAPAAQAAPPPAPAPLPPPKPTFAPIAPPPPPPDTPAPTPPTLEKGQTKDQVVAGFGQPARVVKTGTKEIDYYKDMKVTYTNGKVSAIE